MVEASKRGLCARSANSCPVMPKCKSRRAPIVELGYQVLAAPRQRIHATAAQTARERGGACQEKVAIRRHRGALNGAPDQEWRELAARDFDFRKLGHVLREPTA